MTLAKKPESRLQLRIRHDLEAAVGGKWFKVHGGPFMDAGISDLIGCVDGLYFAFEVNRPETSDDATDLQLEFGEEVTQAGGCFAVVTSSEQAIALVRSAQAEATRRCGSRVFRPGFCVTIRAEDW